MDPEAQLLAARTRGRRIRIAILVSLPVIGAVLFAAYFIRSKQQEAKDRYLVEEISGAAVGCISSLRGDAPETWSLERALEHVSRMERVSRDTTDPLTRRERERFAQLSIDAARGCDRLGALMLEARSDAPHLYFGVPVALARPPDQEDPQRWLRGVLPDRRQQVMELARQIRTMDEAIQARRDERRLMAMPLPIDGHGPDALARVIDLGALPRELERPQVEAWPHESHVAVVRRASIPSVPCDMRYMNRASCLRDFAQRVSWQGDVSPPRELERPTEVDYWAALAGLADRSVVAVGVDRRGRAVLGRYAEGATEAVVQPLDAAVDGRARVEPTEGGFAIIPNEGPALIESGDLTIAAATSPPDPLFAGQDLSGGVRVEGHGYLLMGGDEVSGWTARLARTGGESVLVRAIDGHAHVRRIADLRAHPSGRLVALLVRFDETPDAVALSEDFGRTWVGAATD